MSPDPLLAARVGSGHETKATEARKQLVEQPGVAGMGDPPL